MPLMVQKSNAEFAAHDPIGDNQSEILQRDRSEAGLGLSEETYQKLKRIIDSNVEKPFIDTGTVSEYEETRRKLNAIIKTLGRALNKLDDVERIKTPQELADEIVDHYENQGSARVDSVCADISLLTNEIIKRYMKSESSILIFHLVDKHGLEYVHGHASAAILVGGWLVDPALQGEAVDFGRIVLDREADGYKQFYAKLKEKYSSVPGDPLFSNCVFIEFSQARSDSELRAFYLFENASRMKGPANGTQEENSAFDLQHDAAFIEAYKVNPGDYDAAINAGDAYTHAMDIESARRAYLSAAANNPNLYLANATSAGRLIGFGTQTTEEDVRIAYKLIKMALQIAGKEGLVSSILEYYHYVIADKIGYGDEAGEAEKLYQKYKKEGK